MANIKSTALPDDARIEGAKYRVRRIRWRGVVCTLCFAPMPYGTRWGHCITAHTDCEEDAGLACVDGRWERAYWGGDVGSLHDGLCEMLESVSTIRRGDGCADPLHPAPDGACTTPDGLDESYAVAFAGDPVADALAAYDWSRLHAHPHAGADRSFWAPSSRENHAARARGMMARIEAGETLDAVAADHLDEGGLDHVAGQLELHRGSLGRVTRIVLDAYHLYKGRGLPLDTELPSPKFRVLRRPFERTPGPDADAETVHWGKDAAVAFAAAESIRNPDAVYSAYEIERARPPRMHAVFCEGRPATAGEERSAARG